MGTDHPLQRLAQLGTPDFCFVFGCPRSGTTQLTRLLHAHEAVVIGMERYKRLLTTKRGQAILGPALFDADRFLDFRETDTNLDPNKGQFVSHYAKAERRFRNGTVRYVGDKVFEDASIIAAIARHLPSPRFLFIYRDLVRVASSFEARARDPEDANWPARANYRAGLRRWHSAFRTAEALMSTDSDQRIFVVRYERLFNGDIRTCEALFSFLGLEATADVRRHFEERTSRWRDFCSKPLSLSVRKQRWLLRRLDRVLLARFDRRFEEQLADDHASSAGHGAQTLLVRTRADAGVEGSG